MNSLVYNDANKPLEVNGVSNYPSAAAAGNAFFASDTYSAALSVAVSYAFQIQNPAASGYNLCIDSIYIANTGARVIDSLEVFSGGTLTGATTAISEINVKIGAPTDATTISTSATGLTSGTSLLKMLNLTSLFNGYIMKDLILPPGNSITVVMVSALSVSLLASMTVRYNYWKESI